MDNNVCLKKNGFACKLNLGGYNFDDFMVCRFHESVRSRKLYVTYIALETLDYERFFYECLNNRYGGTLTFNKIGAKGNVIGETVYNIERMLSYHAPLYDYNDDGSVRYEIVLRYSERTDNANGDENGSICDEGTKKEFADVVEAVNCILVGSDKFKPHGIYRSVDYDIESSKKPTIVVCSRRCGMTSHMLSWCFAKANLFEGVRIWYVTNDTYGAHEHAGVMKMLAEEIGYDSVLGKDSVFRCGSKSSIRFVSVTQVSEQFFKGKELPDYVIYEDMAFMDCKRINELMSFIGDGVKQKPIKEVSFSVPSKKGSVFNFLAIVNQETSIEIPWWVISQKECCLCTGSDLKPLHANEWSERMKKEIGIDNFKVEFECQVGSDECDNIDKIDVMVYEKQKAKNLSNGKCGFSECDLNKGIKNNKECNGRTKETR